jgi:hypothetical protein
MVAKEGEAERVQVRGQYVLYSEPCLKNNNKEKTLQNN